MGEYLHYALAAANGNIYAGIDGIGYVGVFGTPALYQTNTDWVDLPCTQGFDTTHQIYGAASAISHDGSVVAGYLVGTTTNGVSVQVAVYWKNGIETVLAAPPQHPGATSMSATAVSGDGTTLLVEDDVTLNTLTNVVVTYVYNIASGSFTSLGALGSATQQTYAHAINYNGTIVAGYSVLDNNNISGFIWNATNGVTVLPIPAEDSTNNFIYLEPTCISDDGATIFGNVTIGGGWVGFRYNAATGYQDLSIDPAACTADGSEAVGISDLYFPALWSAGNGSGFLDHLVNANGIPQGFPTLSSPVTISPDGTRITCDGPDAYLTDQIWYGAWQISLPFPLKTAAIVPSKPTAFDTPYQETLAEPPGTLTQYAEFNTGVSAVLVKGPHYASHFVLNADGSFTYTPKPGYISAGVDPENGTPTDSFTYKLTSTNGTSTNAVVQINVNAPTSPTVDTPTFANVTGTAALLGGDVESDGGAALTGLGVVYAPTTLDSNPQLGDGMASSVAAPVTTGVFAVAVTNLLPDTTYSYAAYASNSMGVSYSAADTFTTAATFASWQTEWFGDPSATNAAANADPYQIGIKNLAVFAFLGPYADPQTASPTELPQVQMSGGYLFYDFYEPADVSGVTYGAMVKTNLGGGSWQPIPDTGSGGEHIFSVHADGSSILMQLTVTVQ